VPLRHTSFVVRDQTGTVIAAHDLAATGALIAVGPAARVTELHALSLRELRQDLDLTQQ
jgi:hypothetical protein